MHASQDDRMLDNSVAEQAAGTDTENETKPQRPETEWDWDNDPHNPYNWPSGRKAVQVCIIASIAFVA